MPTDLGTWGFILSLVALVLLYPAGVLVNLTTPKIKNWWASRSQATLKKRIHILQSRLSVMETVPVCTDFEDMVLI